VRKIGEQEQERFKNGSNFYFYEVRGERYYTPPAPNIGARKV